MPSLRDIRRKIKSVSSTEQITKAMKMVAAARMRRSQSAILSARPFADKMQELIREVGAVRRAGQEEEALAAVRGFFESPADGPVGLVLITADKGLCGAFNATLLRAALERISSNRGRKVYLALVGRKGRDFVRRLSGMDCEVVVELAGIFPKVGFQHAEVLGEAVLDSYFKRGMSRWYAIYNEFKNAAQQRLVCSPLLPVAAPDGAPLAAGGKTDFSYEPGAPRLLQALLPRFVKAQLYRMLLESQAAELAARMNAMDAASKNAAELRETLNMQANRQRQALITREIAELVGGAEALAA